MHYTELVPSRKATRSSPLRVSAQRFHDVQRELQQLDFFLKGTVLKRMMKCGQAQCACHRDPTKRHGPYFEWTYKAKGKTINVKLSPQAAPLSLSSRYQTAPPAQGYSGSDGTSIADRASPLGKASRPCRLNLAPCDLFSGYTHCYPASWWCPPPIPLAIHQLLVARFAQLGSSMRNPG